MLTADLLYFSLSFLWTLFSLPLLFFPRSSKKILLSLSKEDNFWRNLAFFEYLYAFLFLSVSYNIAFTLDGLIAVLGYYMLVEASFYFFFTSAFLNILVYFTKSKWALYFWGIIFLIFSFLMYYLALIY